MSSLTHARRLIRSTAIAVASLAAMLIAAVSPAMASTSTQILSNQTTPNSGVVLTGTDGQQHLWTPDTNFGVCRVDQNADGTYTQDLTSCLSLFGKGNIKPGQVAYDSTTGYLYVTDQAAKSNGVIKVKYDPTLNAGKGGLSVFDRSVLAPTCGGIAGNVPWGAAVGPDHNLYVSFKKNANIVRVKNPAAFSGNCGDVQVMGQSGDRKKSFELAFAGANLWESNNNGIGVIANAPAVTSQAQSTEVFAIPATFALTSDANGIVYVGTANSVMAFDGIAGTTPTTIGSGYAFVSGLSVDPTTVTPGKPAGKLFVGDDPSNGTFNNQGRIWTLTQ